ncbi:MAG: FAD-dependent oxidoreductase [Granulosicoccus sp.]
MNIPTAEPRPAGGFDIETTTLIIGAGACGLVAALAATENKQQVLVIEADAVPAGSTSLSAGLIPAAGTMQQAAAGIHDSPELFAADIQKKANHENEPSFVKALTESSAEVIEWLGSNYGLSFSVVEDFDYPGHSRRRMHGLPTRSGQELIDALRSACEQAGIDIVCHRRACVLHYEGRQIHGVTVRNTTDSSLETIACDRMILACNGFGGNRSMVTRHMPLISEALWFGHSGNQGEAVQWGEQINASVHQLGAYQGHGNVAHPHGILISWAVIMQGGIQVNCHGERFWDETQGYSEAARAVMSQPGGKAVTVFDQRIARVARQFEDFKQAESAGAVIVRDNLRELADHFQLPAQALEQTIADLPENGADAFGRQYEHQSLQAPYYAVQVTGALFHTQGGLKVDANGQVRHREGGVFENLFAGGGAACGVSGSADTGYLSGNGLLSAVVLGFRSGRQ